MKNLFLRIRQAFQTSIRNRLTGVTVVIAALPVLIVSAFIGILAVSQIRTALQANALAQLESVRSLKNDQLLTFFEERAGNVKLNSQTETTLSALTDFTDGFNDEVRSLYLGKPDLDAGDDSAYAIAHRQFSPYLTSLKTTFGFFDVFIINRNGQVVYTQSKEDDFGTNLITGEYADTKLAEAFQAALKLPAGETVFSDFAFYAPSGGAPAAFMAAPIYDSGRVVGVFAVQLPLDKISAIMQERTGLGQTGETFLVGQDKLFRSESFFTEDTLLKVTVDTISSNSGLAGETGSGPITDYRGQPAFAAWQPVQIGNLRWAFIAKIDESEALATANQLTTFIITSISVAGFIVIVLAFIVASSISRSFVQPILELKDGATSVASGNLNTVITINRKDELGILGQTFNSMTDQLRQSLENVNRRAVELQSVAEISTQSSAATNVKDMLQTVVDLTKSSYNLYHAHVYLLDDSKTKLVLEAGAGEPGRVMVAEKRSIPLDHPHSLVARAARTAQGAISNDVTKETDFLANPLLPNTRSEMATPIIIGKNVLGVLDVQADIIDRFTEADIAIKTTLSSQIASSLQNIRQYENSQKIASDLSVVAAVGIATSTITDSQKLLQEVVDLSKKSFNLYHAHIYLTNEAGTALDLTAGAGEVGRQMVSEKRSIALDSEQSLVARAARTREGVVVNDVTLDANFLPNPLLPDTRSEMAVPMVVADKVIGVLDVQSETIGRFTDVDVSIKTTLASQIAVALQNARSFAQSQHQAERETAVNTITQRIQSTTSIEAALQIAARELGHALGMKSTLVTLEPEGLAGRVHTDTDHENPSQEIEPMGTGVLQ